MSCGDARFRVAGMRYNLDESGVGIGVVPWLPKPVRRVRLPYPAPEKLLSVISQVKVKTTVNIKRSKVYLRRGLSRRCDKLRAPC
jgi:hypothetical protein